MPLIQFSLYTTAGSLVWNTALIGAGYELGVRWHHVEDYVGDIANLLYIALGVAVIPFVFRRVRRRYRGQARPRTERYRRGRPHAEDRGPAGRR